MESLKRRYGSAVVSLTPDELIQVRKGNRAIKPIARLNLAAVIEARMTDIAEYVWNEIREAGFAKKLSAGIVLTGGVADLKNVADLFNRVTGQETRVACAEIGVATESLEKVSSPNYTLAVSMLLRGAKVGACPVGVLHTPAQPVQPVERETIVQQPRQSAGVGAGVAGMAGVAGAAAQHRSVNDSFGTQPTDERAAQSVTQRVATPKLSTPDVDDYDDDDDDFEDDVKSGGGFFGKIKGWFDDAFRNPDEEEDEM